MGDLDERGPFSCTDANVRMMASGIDYLQPEVTTGLADPRTLLAAVERRIDDPLETAAWLTRRAAYLERCPTRTDGNACERILTRMEEFARLPLAPPTPQPTTR